MEASEKRLAYAAWAAVCFFWGTTYLAIRVGVEELPPSLFAGLRHLVAGLLLFGWMRLRGHDLPKGRDWLHLTIVGLSLLAVGNWMVVWAEKTVPSGLAALLVATSPFWMSGVESLLPGGDRLTVRGVLGLLVGFGGLVYLLLPQLQGQSINAGMLLGFLAVEVGCASWALGSVYSRRNPVSVKPLMGASIQMLVAGVALTLLGTFQGEWPRFHFSPKTGAAMLYLIVFGSIVAYSSYTYALQKLPISTVSLYAYLNPIIAVFLGWWLLGEHVGAREGIAMAVILGGVMLVQSQRQPPKKAAEEKPEEPALASTGRLAQECE